MRIWLVCFMWLALCAAYGACIIIWPGCGAMPMGIDIGWAESCCICIGAIGGIVNGTAP